MKPAKEGIEYALQRASRYEHNGKQRDERQGDPQPSFALRSGQPREPVPEPWYNATYIFGMTRGVANSTMAPAGKAPLFVLTVPLDLVFLPFTLIGGLFG